jgi:hypothetical protein
MVVQIGRDRREVINVCTEVGPLGTYRRTDCAVIAWVGIRWMFGGD